MRYKTYLKGFLALAVLIAAFLIVFRTDAVNVSGARHISTEEVLYYADTQPFAGNTALTWLYFKIRPMEIGGFVESADVTLEGVRTLHVRVHEKSFAGCFLHGSFYWYFDREGVLCASSDKNDAQLGIGIGTVPVISGVDVETPAEGYILPGAETGIYERLYELSVMLSKGGYFPDVILIGEEEDVTITFGRIRVLLGDLSNLDIRIRAMSEILPETEGLSGELDLSGYTGEEEGVLFYKDGGS